MTTKQLKLKIFTYTQIVVFLIYCITFLLTAAHTNNGVIVVTASLFSILVPVLSLLGIITGVRKKNKFTLVTSIVIFLLFLVSVVLSMGAFLLGGIFILFAPRA